MQNRILPLLGLAALSLSLACGAGLEEVGSTGPVSQPADPSLLPEAPAAPSALTLMSWNVEWLDTAGKGMVPRTDAELKEMAQVISKAQPDVVVLQEVASAKAAQQLLPKGQWTLYVEDRQDDQRVVIGVRAGLTSAGHPDQKAVAVGNRGLRHGVDVQVGEGPSALRILGVHLKAGCQWDPLQGKEECVVLGKQASAIEDWVDARHGAGDKLVVMGDFNRQMHTQDAFFLELNDGEPSGLRLELGPEKLPACEPNRRQSIDHVLADGARLVSSAQVPIAQPPLSDHCPIVATVEL